MINFQLQPKSNIKGQQIQMIDSQIEKPSTPATATLSSTTIIYDENSKENLQHLTKHEQRKLNLKRKRSREQLLQVVDSFIREATLFTVYQSYVEANFQNDMLNMSNDIVTQVVREGLTLIVSDLMAEIYVANEASDILQNVIVREVSNVCNHCLTINGPEDDIDINYYNDPNDANGVYDDDENESQLEGDNEVNDKEDGDKVEDEGQDEISNDNDNEEIMKEEEEDYGDNDNVSIIEQESDSYQDQDKEEEDMQNKVNQIKVYEEVIENGLKQFIIEICEKQLQAIEMEQIEIQKKNEVEISLKTFQKIEVIICEEFLKQTVNAAEQEQVKIQKALNIISEELVDKFLIEQIVKDNVDHQIISMEFTQASLDKQIKSEVQLTYIGEVIENTIIKKEVYQTVQEQLQICNIEKDFITSMIYEIFHEAKREFKQEENQIVAQLAYDYIQETITSQITFICQEELQKEIEIQNKFEKMIERESYSLIKEQYQEQIAMEMVLQEMMLNIFTSTFKEGLKTQRDIEQNFPQQIQNQIIEDFTIQECFEISEQSLTTTISNKMYHNLSSSIITTYYSQTLDLALLLDDIYSSILTGILTKEVKFYFTLEQDALALSNVLFADYFDTFTQNNLLQTFVPYEVYHSIIDDTVIDETRGVTQDIVIIHEQSEDLMAQLAYQMILEVLVESANENKVNREKQVETQKTAINLYHQQFINKFIKKWIYSMLNELVLKLITEGIYKRIMGKVIKRSLYKIIQQSVDTIYNLEEDTISMANRILDGFILKQLDSIMCKEILITQDSLSLQDLIITDQLEQYTKQVVQEVINEQMTGTTQVRTSNPQKNNYQVFMLNDHQYDNNLGSDLIRIDLLSDSEDEVIDQEASGVSGDADIFSDQDEIENPNQIDQNQSLMSPSKKPDFLRNILSNSKSVSNSVNKYRSSQNLHFIDQQQQQTVSIRKPVQHFQHHLNHHQRHTSDMELKAMKFTQNQQNRYNKIHENYPMFSQDRSSRVNNSQRRGIVNSVDCSPTVRVHHRIQLHQDLGGNSADIQQSSFEGKESLLSTLNNLAQMRKENYAIIGDNILMKPKIQTEIKQKLSSHSRSEKSLLHQNHIIIQRQSVDLSEDDEDLDKNCTVQSDEDEDRAFTCQNNDVSKSSDSLYFKGALNYAEMQNKSKTNSIQHSVNISTVSNSRSNQKITASSKRIARVLAHQPKEGFKFIESKAQSSAQSQKSLDIPLKKYDHFLAKRISIERIQKFENEIEEADSTIKDSYREKIEINQGVDLYRQNKDPQHKYQRYFQDYQEHYQKGTYQQLQTVNTRGSTTDFINYSSENALQNNSSPPVKSFRKIELTKNLISQNHSNQKLNHQYTQDKISEAQVNFQLEKLLLSFKSKYQDIKKTNCKSSQLARYEQIILIGQQIINCNQNVDLLFDIDQQLKEILIKLSSNERFQESNQVLILFTNQLALLNYQKVSTLVEKRSGLKIKSNNTATTTTIQVNLQRTPKAINNYAQFKSQKAQPLSSSNSSHQKQLLQSHASYYHKLQRKKSKEEISHNSRTKSTLSSAINNSMVNKTTNKIVSSGHSNNQINQYKPTNSYFSNHNDSIKPYTQQNS